MSSRVRLSPEGFKYFQRWCYVISNLVIQTFGKYAHTSYDSYDITKNNWRYKYEYNDEVLQECILQTRAYWATLPHSDKNTTDMKFLDAIAYNMADFLSAYGVRGIATNVDNPGTKRTTEYIRTLKAHLFDESEYIRDLRLKKKLRRREFRKDYISRKQSQAKHAKAEYQKARKFTNDIMQEFRDAQKLRGSY